MRASRVLLTSPITSLGPPAEAFLVGRRLLSGGAAHILALRSSPTTKLAAHRVATTFPGRTLTRVFFSICSGAAMDEDQTGAGA